MFKHIFKVQLKPDLAFNVRERTINTEIQKESERLNSQGFIVESHEILGKHDTHATVRLNLIRMPRL